MDFEGIPANRSYYLIGLLVTHPDGICQKSFWADRDDGEALIFTEMLDYLRGGEGERGGRRGGRGGEGRGKKGRGGERRERGEGGGRRGKREGGCRRGGTLSKLLRSSLWGL